MNPSPSTDRQYINFNVVFYIKSVLMQPVLNFRCLGGRYRTIDRYMVPGGELSGAGTYVRYLIHECFTL
jgi:hypothetical protein